MMKSNKVFDDSESNKMLSKAVEFIENNDYEEAKSILKEVASIDVENPKIYNLLGIIYERNRDIINATKYYRVAYYMDQGFKAASENLDRLSDIYYRGCSDVSWGLGEAGGTKR